MNKNSVKGYAILGILFALVSVVVFAVPTAKTPAFWIAYGFTVVAFAVQPFIWKLALGREKSLKSKFLRFPVIYIAVVYLAITKNNRAAIRIPHGVPKVPEIV